MLTIKKINPIINKEAKCRHYSCQMPANPSKVLDLDSIPFSGKPKPAFCSITFQNKDVSSALTNEDFFDLRSSLLSFLLPYKINIMYPFDFVRNDCRQLMICFECNPKIKELVYNFLYMTRQYDHQYNLTFNFDILD